MKELIPYRASKPDAQQHIIRIIGTVIIMLMIVATVALAIDDLSADPKQAIQKGVIGGMEELYGIMTAVVIPIAAVFFAWNAFKAFFGGERGMEQAKKNMLIIVAVLALVYLGPVIIQQVAGWFNTTGTGNVFTTP